MTTLVGFGGVGTDIGPYRVGSGSDRSLSAGTDRDRSSCFGSSCARAKSDLDPIRPCASLHVRQGRIGTDFWGYDGLHAHAPKDPNLTGTDIGPSRPCPGLWITR